MNLPLMTSPGLTCNWMLQVFAIELVTFAVDFVLLAVEFGTFAVEFVGLQ